MDHFDVRVELQLYIVAKSHQGGLDDGLYKIAVVNHDFPVGLTGNPGLYVLPLFAVGLYGVDGLQPLP